MSYAIKDLEQSFSYLLYSRQQQFPQKYILSGITSKLTVYSKTLTGYSKNVTMVWVEYNDDIPIRAFINATVISSIPLNFSQ